MKRTLRALLLISMLLVLAILALFNDGDER